MSEDTGTHTAGTTGVLPLTVTNWMVGYIAAWESNNPQDIRALFTKDAVYATRPNDPSPWRGQDEIVEKWIASADEPEDWTFEWSLVGIDGDTAFVRGVTTYLNGQPTYDNLWIVRFAPDGRASAFTEWFMARDTTQTPGALE